MDCGASRTVTGSLLNTREVIEKTINIETADGKQSLKSTHTCLKTYFLRNRTGEVKPITVQAIFVMGFPQDLLGGKSLNQENILVILDSDKDSDICGVYPLNENNEEHYQESFAFISEPGRLINKTERFLIMFFIVFVERIDSRDLWVLVQDVSNIFLV